jgi:aminopeptidase N
MSARSVLTLVALLLGSACITAQRQPLGRSEPSRHVVDIEDYAISLVLPEQGKIIQGDAVLTVRRTARVDTLVLDLIDLTVDSILVDGLRTGFVRLPGTIHVPLRAGGNDRFHVDVTYHGEVEDGLIIRTDSEGRWTGFGDNWPNRARYWIPSVDDPSDKATVAWSVTAPADRTVVANGVLVDRTSLPNGVARTRWRESHPIATYLMVIAAAPLVAYSLGETACGLALGGGCVPQTVYTAPEQRSILPGPFAQAPEIVRYFASLVGPFPYEKLAHLQSSTRFGGMENATAIFYADEAFRRGSMNEGLIAHETAHQWFGDAVTEREWPHLWLSEGFATYFAALFVEHAHGDGAFRERMRQIRSEVLGDRESVPTHPVIDTAQTNLLSLLDRNSYEKGGFVLHMLRRQVGDSAFFGALRAYYAAHRDATALSDDLRADMERVSRQRLGWFFDQWLRRPGYPEVNVTWSYDPSSHQISLDVAQAGRYGAFRFPLTVAVREAGGVVRRETIVVPAERQAHVVLRERFASTPQALEADPDVDLLARFDVHSNR